MNYFDDDWKYPLTLSTWLPPRELPRLPATKTVFYILWNPDYADPPRRRFTSLKEAQRVAADMAKRHTGSLFYVCRVGESAQVILNTKVTVKKLEVPKTQTQTRTQKRAKR